MSIALITGASAGLGRALAHALANEGWDLVVDARTSERLDRVAGELSRVTRVTALVGDVTDSAHRGRLSAAVGEYDAGLDLLVNNASTLGPSPLVPLVDLSTDDLTDILATNVVAPHALIRLLLPALTRAGGVLLNISSDAAVEHYEGWGGYAASKAALDHLTLTLAAENPGSAFYAVDPGDMRTDMHQRAFPGEDISDRPEPETVVPALVDLVRRRPASGRLKASDLGPEAASVETRAVEGAVMVTGS